MFDFPGASRPFAGVIPSGELLVTEMTLAGRAPVDAVEIFVVELHVCRFSIRQFSMRHRHGNHFQRLDGLPA